MPPDNIIDDSFDVLAGSGKCLWNLVLIDANADMTRQAAQKARNIANENLDTFYYSEYFDDEMYDFDTNTSTLAENQFDSNDVNKCYVMTPMGGDTKLINVVDDYAWTLSPKKEDMVRKLAPYAYLRELQPVQNAKLQSALYQLDALFESVQSAGDVTNKMLENNFGSASELLTHGMDMAASGVSKLQDAKNALLEKVSKTLGNKGAGKTVKLDSTHLLPYNKLYECTETGWQYKLPMFADNLSVTQPNTFGKPSGTALSTLADIAETANKYIGGMMAVAHGIQSNLQRNTETVKMYTPPDMGSTFVIKFPLINTASDDDLAQNWQLVELLKYQSRPYRTSKNLLMPVYLYEVMIPGTIYTPYAFMQNVQIEHKGVRTPCMVDVIINNTKSKRKIIAPEAYEITITMQSLINETQNFMVEALLDTRKMII